MPGLPSILLPPPIQSRTGLRAGRRATCVMAEEGARGSIRPDQALPAASLAWLAMTPLQSPQPPGNQRECQTMLVSTSQTCLHRRALFKRLSGSQAGEGPVPRCPGTQAGHSALHWAPSGLPGRGSFPGTGKEGEPFTTAQDKPSSSYNIPFPPSCVQAHVPVPRGGSKPEPPFLSAGTSAGSRDSPTWETA